MTIESGELAEKLSEDLYYWQSKNIDISVVFRNDPATKFETYEDWLEAHFLLSDEVGGFLEQLEAFLRELNTTTNAQYVQTRGELRGPVDWKRTIEYRARTNYQDNTRFVCRERSRSFETDKNLVLKQLLETLREIGDEELNLSPENEVFYQDGEEPEAKDGLRLWNLRDTDDDESRSPDYRETVVETLQHNIYLNEINSEEQSLTDRTISEVTKAREPMYREAAELLQKYRKIRSLEEDDKDFIKELLENGSFLPGDKNTLFELYWIFELLPNPNSDNLYYSYPHGGDSDDKKIAEWKSDGHKYKYKLYHDKGTFDNYNLSFKKPDICFKNDPKQVDQVSFESEGGNEAESYVEFEYATERAMAKTDALGVGQKDEQTKRPDIVLLKQNEDEEDEKNLEALFVGEIKNSDSTNTIRSGARELIEYVLMVCYNHGNNEEIPYLTEGESEELTFSNSTPIRAGLFFESGPGDTNREADSENNLTYELLPYDRWKELRDENDLFDGDNVFGECVFEGDEVVDTEVFK